MLNAAMLRSAALSPQYARQTTMMLPRIVPVSPTTTMSVLRSMVTTTILPAVLPVRVIPLVPKMLTGVPDRSVSLGASLRDRATLPSPLRGLGPSGGYPSRLRSLRSLRAPLARRLAALPTVAGPPPSSSPSTASVARPPCPPRAGAARRARRSARLARPGRLRRLRASPRLVAAALRAPPVSASPSTGSRTARCSRVRTSADPSARASGSVLRTTAPGSGRIARHSVAVAAPLRRVPRRRFPLRSPSNSRLSGRPSAFRLHTRRIVDAEGAVAFHGCEGLVMRRSLARLSAPGVPEILATDRCSQPSLDYVAGAAPSRPCHTEHLSGFCRVTADPLEFSCKHL